MDASKFVAGLNAAASEEDKIDFDGKVQIKIDRLVISNTVASDFDPFSEADAQLKTLIADTDAEAHNILDFDFEIAAEGADDNYVIKADFDLDPFVLTEMMKYSDQTKGTDGKYAQSAQGQEFWKGKMADALAKAGTATIIVTKNGDTGSTFDRPVEGVDKTSVIAYGKIDSKEIDVFVWDPANNKEVTFDGLTFPMDLNTFAGLMIKDATNPGYTEKATTSAVSIEEIFGYVKTFMDYLEPLFASFGVNAGDMSFTIQYASLIDTVVMPVITALGDMTSLNLDTSWLEGNLEGILAAIFGTYVPAGEDTAAVIDPAEEVVFTLESFEYAGTAIYPKAA